MAMSVRTAIQQFANARRAVIAVLGASAVGGLALAPQSAQAIQFKVKGYIQARALPLAAQSESQFLTNDAGFIRLDFQITNYNSASVDTSSTSQWGPIPTSQVFDYLIISQCIEQTDCPVQSVSSVTTGAWNSDPAVTDLQRFQVNGWNTMAMTSSSFPSDAITIRMAFGASTGGTGLFSKLSNVDKQITDIQIGNWMSNTSPLITTQMLNWKQIGANGNNSPSDMTASNIITNLGISVGQTFFDSPGSSGVVCSGDPSGPMCQLALRFGGEDKQVFFNINAFNFRAVPGPLPLAGAAAAFAYSRRLRSRVRQATTV